MVEIFQFLSGFQGVEILGEIDDLIIDFQFLSGFQAIGKAKLFWNPEKIFQFLSGFQVRFLLKPMLVMFLTFNSFPDSSDTSANTSPSAPT